MAILIKRTLKLVNNLGRLRRSIVYGMECIRNRFFNRDIVFNTFKISMAAIIAIAFATALKLDYAISAGTVAILSIQPTKRETVSAAVGRLIAFFCALVISFLCYEVLGYTLYGFAAYLILYIFACQIFRWYSSMAVNSVLISHFLTMGEMNRDTVWNECLLFWLGVSIGVMANLHLHKNVDYIEELKESTDEQIRQILYCMSERIMNRRLPDDNEERFTQLRVSIDRAKEVAEENYNNQLRRRDVYDREYILMREKQCLILYEMYKTAHQIHTTPITAKRIAAFLEEMSGNYHKTNTGKELMEKFCELDAGMKNRPLPTERTEFEDRARLFFLLRYTEEFIQIKMDFANQQRK